MKRADRTLEEVESWPTSGKFCSAKALAMLWSSVQVMASAMASTPRQFAAVSCFSGGGEDEGREVGELREAKKTRREKNKQTKKRKDTRQLD